MIAFMAGDTKTKRQTTAQASGQVQGQTSGFNLSRRAVSAQDQPISALMNLALQRPEVISLAAGFVDYETLPAASMRQLYDDLLGTPSVARSALQYGTTQGHPPLREALYERLADLDGAPTHHYPGSSEQIVVTTGSQQLLHLLTDVLVDPGEIVITAWPSYFVYTNALSRFQARVRGVDMDAGGLMPDQLEVLFNELEQSGELERVKIVYVCPAHQNPTGRTLSAARRSEVLTLVRRYSQRAGHRILLIEDGAYRELTYTPAAELTGAAAGSTGAWADSSVSAEMHAQEVGGQGQPAQSVDAASELANISPPGSIKQGDFNNEFVALTHTFSKPLAPGMKIGYGLLPDDLVQPVLAAKAGCDFGSSNLAQYVLDEALRTRAYDRHLDRLRRAYTPKRDAILEALDHHLGGRDDVNWTRPNGGLYVWLSLPEAVDTGPDGPLFQAALDAGVLYVPGAYCFADDPTRTAPHNAIRLSFGVPSLDQIAQAIERLAKAVDGVVSEASPLM